ncbi:MAG: ribokinase [Alphaproteobacteria bacterium]|nr:ribokinase [Alphaproteobacteria bacterium]
MITVFGSINLDQVMRVRRLPRPGETVLARGALTAPGGKGANQAVAAARAGARVAMVGRVGRDPQAEAALSGLRAAQVDLRHVATGEAPTGVAAVWVEESGENAIVVASGANALVSAADLPDALLTAGATLLLQMEVMAEANWAAIRRAQAAGMRVVLNLAPAAKVPPEVRGKIDRLIVNEGEARALSGIDDPLAAARSLAALHGLVCIVTLGARGALAVGRDGGFAISSLDITPIDTAGAGDAFVGVFAASEDQGYPLPEALRRASVAGALACLAPGCQPAMADARAIEARLPELPPARVI